MGEESDHKTSPITFQFVFSHFKTFQYYHLPIKRCIPSFVTVNVFSTLLMPVWWNELLVEEILTTRCNVKLHQAPLPMLLWRNLHWRHCLACFAVTVTLSKNNSPVCSVMVIISAYHARVTGLESRRILRFVQSLFWLFLSPIYYLNILSITTGCVWCVGGGVGDQH